MGGPFALDGCRLMEEHNNQLKVGIDNGRGIEEERQLGRNVWGGVVSLRGAANQQRRKNDNKNVVALDNLHPALGQPLAKRVPQGHWLITHGHAAWASEWLHHNEACFRCL